MNTYLGFSSANLRPRLRNQRNSRSIPASRAPVNVEASRESARRSSTSRLCTEDFPHAFASSVISIVIAVRNRAIRSAAAGTSRRASKCGSWVVIPIGHIPVWQWWQRPGDVPSAS